MSFWKKLKKIKGVNVLKSALSMVPGGSTIKAGIEIFEKQAKQAKGLVNPKQPQLEVTSKKEVAKTTSNNTLLYVAIAGIAFYFLVSK